MKVFTDFIDAKDPYTSGHSARVAVISKNIARTMGKSESECRSIYYIALMHDCGKAFVPDAILKKPGKLTPEEFKQIQSHTTYGAKMLKNFHAIPDIIEGALYHHERFDGKGYPTGKAGKDIPEIGRIICIADSYDATTTKRCYREPLSEEQVEHELINGRGTQFDPDILDVFMKLVKKNTVDSDSEK